MITKKIYIKKQKNLNYYLNHEWMSWMWGVYNLARTIKEERERERDGWMDGWMDGWIDKELK